MISFLSHRIALFLKKNEIVDDATSQVCEYGFEIIISTIIGFSLVVLIGGCCKDIFSALLFYIIFVGVRLSTGGYHATTHFRCKFLLCVCCLFVVITSNCYVDYYNIWLHLIIISIYLLTVFVLSPIAHENAPLDISTMQHNRIISIIVSIILAFALLLGYFELKKVVMVSSLTLLVVAFLMILSKIKERRKLYEKGN